ncbi:hypothetical protein SeMB42_g07304 [Synchytrium endobioticum]|uniref:Uncharacterized protein n=1 Tax=Synchytrium endobioticum TaxID=286115 RepID=A0A507C0J1_9FUNG|nr:hypothetical protein SeMB42_g07304 [Synchytrium endobioticum]
MGSSRPAGERNARFDKQISERRLDPRVRPSRCQVRVHENLARMKAKVTKEAAVIRERRRVYNLVYAFYITGEEGVQKFLIDHTPDDDVYEEVPDGFKYFTLMCTMWFNVFYRIFLNIYKYHDLYYPEAPLLRCERVEVLKRLICLPKMAVDSLKDYPETFTLERFAMEDDGFGFIREPEGPYPKLHSEIIKVSELLQMEVKNFLILVQSGNLKRPDRQKVVVALGLPPGLAEDFEDKIRLMTKTELTQLLDNLRNEFINTPSSDASLPYAILKHEYKKVNRYITMYTKLRETVATLDFTDNMATTSFINEVESFLNKMDPDTLTCDAYLKETGEAIYKAIARGTDTGYVEISDELFEEHIAELKPLPEFDDLIILGTGPNEDPMTIISGAAGTHTDGIDACMNDHQAELNDRIGLLELNTYSHNSMHASSSSLDLVDGGSTHFQNPNDRGTSRLAYSGRRRGNRSGGSGSTASSDRIGN